MKIQLLFGGIVEEEEASDLVFISSHDALGPHIETVPDGMGASCKMFPTRDEIVMMKEWCETVLRRQG